MSVAQHLLVRWVLPGQPISCAALCSTCWLVGDSSAGLHLLRLPSASSTTAVWQSLQSSCPLAIPDVLACVPLKLAAPPPAAAAAAAAAGSDQQVAALVVIGSRSSSSQVLGLTHGFMAGLQQQQQQQLTGWRMLQSALLPSLAGPQAAAVFQDSTGARGGVRSAGTAARRQCSASEAAWHAAAVLRVQARCPSSR
jgi:hypothetical protein